MQVLRSYPCLCPRAHILTGPADARSPVSCAEKACGTQGPSPAVPQANMCLLPVRDSWGHGCVFPQNQGLRATQPPGWLVTRKDCLHPGRNPPFRMTPATPFQLCFLSTWNTLLWLAPTVKLVYPSSLVHLLPIPLSPPLKIIS